MMEALHNYLLDVRLVSVSAARVVFYTTVALMPLWPGWKIAKRIKKGGANRFPTVVAGGAVSAALAATVMGIESAVRIANDPAPDGHGLWPLALIFAVAAGLVVYWPGYTLLLHLVLRRRPSEQAKLDGP